MNKPPVYPLVLVSCGRTKGNYAAAAKDLYTSERFKEARRFAEQFAIRWFILSAKHGVVTPETVLEPYEWNIESMRHDERRAWAEDVVKTLQRDAPTGISPLILATNQYSDPISEAYRQISANIVAPLRGMPEESFTRLLAQINSQPSRLADYVEFYKLLERLQRLPYQPALFSSLASKQVARAGVYYFVDNAEHTRFTVSPAHRVVRIGTHAVSKGSKSSLWQRLRTHRGNDDGSGSHRSSIFRLHVGRALLSLAGREHSTWGLGETAGADTRTAEASLEQEVSAYLGSLRVIHLPIFDFASADSDRSYIEMNSIALLTGGGAIDQPGADWLGNSSPASTIRDSGLWNINYVGEPYDPRFLDVLRELITQVESGRINCGSLAPLNWRADQQRGGIGQTNLF